MTSLILISTTILAQTTNSAALKGFDPVELCQGRETPGQASISVEFQGYRYLFATEESKKKFLVFPEKYGIQFGGSCLKMGPGSGKGSPERFATYKGRIYLFASEPCLQWFQLDPDRYIDRPDLPFVSEFEVPRDAARKGLSMVQEAAKFLGGAERLKALKYVQFKHEHLQGQTPFWVTDTWAMQGAFRKDVAYDGFKMKTISLKNGSWDVMPSATEAHAPDTHAALVRASRHQIHFLIWNVLHKRTSATPLGRLASPKGTVNLVGISLNDASTVLAIDAQSGAPRWAKWKGRGTPGIGEIVEHFDEFKSINGVQVPHKVTRVFDGLPVKNGPKLQEVKVDFEPEKGFFDQP